jgi:alpha-methylacyl-CoA racemase
MGPLRGVRVVEFAGLGPGPFCAMLLSDMGAEVVRIDRKGAGGGLGGLLAPEQDVLARGRRSVALDLKKAAGVEAALALVARADALVEGFRPGVMERLGLGPEACLAANPRLVYGRMTGWGQEGPLARAPGHDIDYIALSSALHGIGRREGGPVPPLNLVGDMGGGGLVLAFGIACALLEARASGTGQVVDAAMTDGAALLTAMFWTLKATGAWTQERGTNLLDGGAPYYDTYACADGKWIAVGALEPQFYAELRARCGVAGDAALDGQEDPSAWPEQKARFAALFRTRTRAEWCALLEGTDACVAPVLDMDEAPAHPHNRARGTFVEVRGVVQPAPAPRFSRTPAAVQGPPVAPGANTEEVLREWGVGADAMARLRAAGAM